MLPVLVSNNNVTFCYLSPQEAVCEHGNKFLKEVLGQIITVLDLKV